MATVEIDVNNTIVFGNRIVGEFDEKTGTLVLNLAWCRLAGLGVRIDGDSTDRRRVILDRSLNGQPEQQTLEVGQ
jgi:hypothetical protein